MEISSTAFPHGGEIPRRHTCDGEDLSPPLIWTDVPADAQSLALIVEDPDADHGTWVHWVLFDLPPTSTGLPEGADQLGGGGIGLNDWQRAEWGGPAPPTGRHHYMFTLFALDRRLDLDHPTSHELEAMMAGHVLAESHLIGTYRKVAS